VRVTYVAGFGAAADVPEAVKGWMEIAICTYYDNRAVIASGQHYELPRAFHDALLDGVTILKAA
jgi:hypothetical protein